MTTSTFDLRKFIGRETEIELFEKLLGFATAGRILSVTAKGGDGKSFLLKYFESRCRTGNPRLPYSLISFKDQPFQSPLSVIKKLAEDLSRWGIQFEKFHKTERARIFRDFVTVSALANVQGNDFRGATDTQAAGIILNNPRFDGTVNILKATEPLPPEQDKAARDTGIHYFVEELHTYCAEKPVVIMFDTYERCGDIVRAWFENEFLETNFFRSSCESCQLVLVVAGQTIPTFNQMLPLEECASKIIPVNELGPWTKDNVEQCLRAYGINTYEAKLVDSLHGLIEQGFPLLNVVELIDIHSKNPQEQK